jgi:hypothetical protein
MSGRSDGFFWRAKSGARLGWSVSPSGSMALTGENLLRSRHHEFTDGSYIRRGVFAETEWRF